MNSSKSVVLFLSVDVVGSTNFKTAYEAANGSTGWIAAFEAFFAEFPLVFLGNLALASKEQDELAEARVWKVLGDEVVFAVYPNGPGDALAVVLAFYRTVIQFDARFFERWPLRVRGCAWGARLDTRNRHIVIPEMQPQMDGQPFDDYLGPDVDIGFRLSGCAGRGQVVISSNLAESLARLGALDGLRFHHVGRRVLKGVYGGRPYPVILISTMEDPPDFWEWEPTEDAGLLQLRTKEPTPPEFLVDHLARIRAHLRRMHQVDAGPPLFDNPVPAP